MSEHDSRSLPRVFLVEDNVADVRLVEEGIEMATLDIELNVARTSSKAIESLIDADHDETRLPQLIILDLNLPGRSGLEVLEEIRNDESLRSVPVVVASSSENPDDIDRAYEQSANAYVSKPTDPDDYIQMIAALSEFWIANANSPSQ